MCYSEEYILPASGPCCKNYCLKCYNLVHMEVKRGNWIRPFLTSRFWVYENITKETDDLLKNLRWETCLLIFSFLKPFLEIQTNTDFFKQKWHRHILTKNTAIDIPITNPAITSDQWFRYSATLLIPVRKAKHIKPKHRTGFASLVPLAFTVLVIYIWKLERKKA